MSLYLAPALAKRAGVTLRQVQYWTEIGVLRTMPITGAGDGSGNYRIYSEREVEVARAVNALRSLQDVGKAVRSALDDRPAHIAGLTIQRTAVTA